MKRDGEIPWVREYDDVVAASPAYWRAMREASSAAFLPNLTTGYWDYPWNDGPIEVRNRSVDAFRRLCREARRYAEETGVKRVCLGPLNYTPADIGRGPYPVEDDDGGPVKPFNGLKWR